MQTDKKRIVLLDVLRGAAMLYVMLYHFMYDWVLIYGRKAPVFLTPGESSFEIVHIFFLWVLFFVSGVCSALSRNSLKRGALLYIIGYLITAGTELFMPSELIVFGVLSCFGACMVLTSFISPLIDRSGDKQIYLSPAFAVLWFVFRNLNHGQIDLIFTKISVDSSRFLWLYPLGLPGDAFSSADYFPLIPFLFIFLCGRCASEKTREICSKADIKESPVSFIGKHSLWAYAIHQPVFLGLLYVFFELLKI